MVIFYLMQIIFIFEFDFELLYRVSQDLLVSSYDFLVRSHDFLIVSHRFLVRSHNALDIRLDKKNLENDQIIVGTHKKKYGNPPKIDGNQPINRGKPCNTCFAEDFMYLSYAMSSESIFMLFVQPIFSDFSDLYSIFWFVFNYFTYLIESIFRGILNMYGKIGKF